MKLLIAILSLIFLLILLLLTRIRVQVHYLREGKDDELALHFSILRGLIRFRLELPVIKFLAGRFLRPAVKIKAELTGGKDRLLAEKKEVMPLPPLRQLLLLFREVRWYRPAAIYLFSRVLIRRFYWRSVIGLVNPAQTAVAFGLLWGLKGFFLSAAYPHFAPGRPKPEIIIIPSFQKPVINTTLDCIFEVRASHILVTGFFIFRLRLKKSRGSPSPQE
jgi:hypothetical protein